MSVNRNVTIPVGKPGMVLTNVGGATILGHAGGGCPLRPTPAAGRAAGPGTGPGGSG